MFQCFYKENYREHIGNVMGKSKEIMRKLSGFSLGKVRHATGAGAPVARRKEEVFMQREKSAECGPALPGQIIMMSSDN